MKILLTGASGQLGWELQHSLQALGQVVAPCSQDFDLAEPDSMVRLLRELRPGLVVNAAAYTAVDRAESEPERAMALNARAPGVLAEECRRLDAFLVHFSTDYVFDGAKPLPYVETDVAAPINAYGLSKLMGEQAVQACGGRYLILRTSWLYGVRGSNFVLAMRRLLNEPEEVPVVADQLGTPCWSRWLAETTVHMLKAGAPAALYHVVPAGAVSRYELACAIKEVLGGVGRIRPVPSSQYPLPARRPLNSQLSCRRLETDFGMQCPDWRQLLESCLEEIQAGR